MAKAGDSTEILARLRSLSRPESLEGMSRFGIETKRALGVSIPKLRALAKETGKDHELAQELWASGVHEARILATMVDDPRKVSEEQMELWTGDFDSWDVCDQCCSNLFDKTCFARAKAVEWSEREQEFVKRAGFVLMATLAVHDKEAPDGEFLRFLSAIKESCDDERNFVKKAVNWALRQIGKRNIRLNKAAVRLARDILKSKSKTAKWIASDALRELTSRAVQAKLSRKD
jgi:3-methyladenine DNA glycosylase AlkD